jgi:hypothetical protein
MTPNERSLRGRVGAYTLHAKGGTNTAAARAAFMERFEQEADPEGLLPKEERLRRADFAKRAHFAKLALKAAKTRRTRKRAKANEGPGVVQVPPSQEDQDTSHTQRSNPGPHADNPTRLRAP